MADLDALYDGLKAEIDELKTKFLSSFLPANPEHGPEDFAYEVKSFSILSHAAFEEYVETLSESLMIKVEKDLLSRKATLATACFLASYGVKLDLSGDDEITEKSCFDHIREAVMQAKTEHSKAIMDNHGFSAKYMRKLLVPVGVSMPKGPEMGSLRKLVDARGSFAHSMSKLAHYGPYKRANRPFTPEDASKAAQDCLKLCEGMKDRAKAIW